MRDDGRVQDRESQQVQWWEGTMSNRRSFLGKAGALAAGMSLGALAGGGTRLAAADRERPSREGPRGEWGPRVDLARLRDNYAPQEVKPFVVPPGGIDNLGLHSTDVFTIPGQGEFAVDFSGYFRVARAYPSSYTWGAAEIRVNIIDLRLFGKHERLGEISVQLNPEILSTGQIMPKVFATGATEATAAAAEEPQNCRIATAAIFTVGPIGEIFNKEPILLMNEHVTRIPPVDDPSGHALLFRLPLYHRRDPDGEPVAYLTSLRYGADHYITEAEARAFRERRS